MKKELSIIQLKNIALTKIIKKKTLNTLKY